MVCNERRAVFTLICCSFDGIMGRECLAIKWGKHYGEVMAG